MGIICNKQIKQKIEPITINTIVYYKKVDGYTLKIQIAQNNKDISKYNNIYINNFPHKNKIKENNENKELNQNETNLEKKLNVKVEKDNIDDIQNEKVNDKVTPDIKNNENDGEPLNNTTENNSNKILFNNPYLLLEK